MTELTKQALSEYYLVSPTTVKFCNRNLKAQYAIVR